MPESESHSDSLQNDVFELRRQAEAVLELCLTIDTFVIVQLHKDVHILC